MKFYESAFMKRRGFTLIELLVVIAIIATLSAILSPVFDKASEKAKQISCLSNLKQLGAAFRLYLDDHDQRFGAGSWKWRDEVEPYIIAKPNGTMRDVFGCPFGEVSLQKFPNYFFDYGVNYQLRQYVNARTISSASTILVADRVTDVWDWAVGYRLNKSTNEWIPIYRIAERHNGQGNIVFCDGHVMSMSNEETLYPINHWGVYTN